MAARCEHAFGYHRFLPAGEAVKPYLHPVSLSPFGPGQFEPDAQRTGKGVGSGVGQGNFGSRQRAGQGENPGSGKPVHEYNV